MNKNKNRNSQPNNFCYLKKSNKMHIHYIPYTFFLIIFITSISTTTSQPDHFLKPPSSPPHLNPQPSLELTLPLPSSNLPPPPPQCTLLLINYTFGNTYSQPPLNLTYSPPLDCPPPWSHAVLHFSGEISGEQYDRIAGVWISGVEILRTSTPGPSDNGTFWNFSKDVTRYSSVLELSNVSLSMMLENIVNDRFDGVYRVNLSIEFYRSGGDVVVRNRKLGLGLGFGDLGVGELGGGVYDEPADLVIPIADDGKQDYWFRIEKGLEKVSRSIEIPMNARRVVLELYVSAHGNDEFWYSNSPTEYMEMNKLSLSRGNGAFREVFVKIDGSLVGSEVPFPVIYTGGINPLSWDPVVAIGAFDLPSYDIELTPFLGSLLDGKNHSIELGVANALSFWLVDANLHVWVDNGSSMVQAGMGMGVNEPSEYEESREFKFKELDGSFEIEVERKTHSSGWVNCSMGNFTTSLAQKLKFKNKIEFQQYGTQKIVEQKVKVKTEVTVVSDTGLLVSSRTSKREYPLKLVITTTPGPENDTSLVITNISHEIKEKSYCNNLQTSIQNVQESGGSMVVKDQAVLSATAETQQTLSYKGPSGCFSRSAQAAGGELLRDDSAVCATFFNKNPSNLLSQ